MKKIKLNYVRMFALQCLVLIVYTFN